MRLLLANLCIIINLCLLPIDGKGIIRHIMINDFSVGRNVDETLRIVKGKEIVVEETCQTALGSIGFLLDSFVYFVLSE